MGCLDSVRRPRLAPDLRGLSGNAQHRTRGGRQLAQRLWDTLAATPWVAVTQATEVIVLLHEEKCCFFLTENLFIYLPFLHLLCYIPGCCCSDNTKSTEGIGRTTDLHLSEASWELRLEAAVLSLLMEQMYKPL